MWLTDACRRIQGEVEEEVLYNMFRIYHVQMADVVKGKSDVAMFRHVCINKTKMCTREQGLASFDGYEPDDDKIELADI